MKRKLAKPDPLQRMSITEVREIFKKISDDDPVMVDRLESELSRLRLQRMHDMTLSR